MAEPAVRLGLARLGLARDDEVPAGEAWLGPRERAVQAGLRVPPRRASWRLGRLVAKRLLAGELGLAADQWHRVELLAAADGAPEPHLDGRPLVLGLSLSHSGGRAACLVGPPGGPLGVDLEQVVPRSAAFGEDFFTESERAWIAAAADPVLAVNLAWSAKESALKALRTGLRRDTREVVVTLPGAPERGGWRPLTAAVDGRVLAGWWRREAGLVLTCVVPGDQSEPPGSRSP